MGSADRAFWWRLLLIWIGVSAAAIALSYGSITTLRMSDPDDVMRLVEVRDWLGGQAWYDVSQHRMNPPFGLSMHWSRMVDLPLAAAIAIVRPFAGQRLAETIAAVAIPMLTLGSAMLLIAALARRWLANGLALLAAGLSTTSVAVWFAMRPMRIDHHGWQISAGLGIALALTAAPTRRNAAIAGLCAALWTQISLEGLPFAAAAAAWLGLRAMIGSREEADRLSAYLAALTIAAALLLLTFRGPIAFAHLNCDAISTVHLAALGLATSACLIAAPLSRPLRIAVLIGGAGIAAMIYKLGAGSCMGGPFAQLGPLGYRIWYRGVNEGVPLWRLSPELIALWAPLPIVGLIAAVLRYTRKPDPTLLTYIVLLATATAIGLLVMRASGFANLLAMPGAMMGLAAIARANRAASPPRHILTLTAAIFLFSPLGAALACAIVETHGTPTPPTAPVGPACEGMGDFAVLDRFPPTVIITPIDTGPALIAGSHHRTITGPYHRDPQALEDVLRFFMTSPAEAREIARKRGARYLAYCPGDRDLPVMAKAAPGGLAAALERGPVSWLDRVALPGSLHLYRISATASTSTR